MHLLSWLFWILFGLGIFIWNHPALALLGACPDDGLVATSHDADEAADRQQAARDGELQLRERLNNLNGNPWKSAGCARSRTEFTTTDAAAGCGL
jgi:hypothetical protein